MNAKQNLADKIINLLIEDPTPEFQRVWEVLSTYQIGYIPQEGGEDFQRQAEHFLFAKRSEGASTATIANYKLYLNILNKYIDKSPVEITVTDLRDFIGYLSEHRGLKIVSVQSVINIMRSFFGWLQQEELITSNPTSRIKSFKIDKKDSRHPLTPEQLELLRNACLTYREKALVEFLYSSGCRVSEAEQIELNTVDLNQRSVDVIGKGSKRRTLYFSVRARLMIQCYLSERVGGTGLFCAGKKPYARLGTRSIERIIRGLGVRAGIAKNVHPHILRHTLATDLLNSGMDITIIQHILGHSSVGTTQIYAEMSQESVQREYRKYVA